MRDAMAQALLGEASDPLGRWVWHVYEDLGDSMLAHRPVSAGEIRAAVEVVAQLHLRFEGHPLIDECRAMCGGRGMEFFDRHVLRAIQQLELLSSRMSGLTDGCEDLLNGLVARRDGSADRARLMREFGGPATFLHGDLWTSNVCVVPSADGHRARLIDWDRAGVGPISYDLSALLRRFERGDRMQILDHYREAVGHANWPVPSNREMNALFDTAEHARIANEVAWLAVAAMQDDAGWAITELAGIAVFAGSLRPLLPD